MEVQTGVVKRRLSPKVKPPSMYKVILLNDDFTPMGFVVELLQTIFNKNFEQAREIMLRVHRLGSAVCGLYTFEVAETKMAQVMKEAKKHEHPLQCTIEKD